MTRYATGSKLTAYDNRQQSTRCGPSTQRHIYDGFQGTTAVIDSRRSIRSEAAVWRGKLRRDGCFAMSVRRYFKPLSPRPREESISQMPVAALHSTRLAQEERGRSFWQSLCRPAKARPNGLVQALPRCKDAAPMQHPSRLAPPLSTWNANRNVRQPPNWSARCRPLVHKAAMRPDFVACEGVAAHLAICSHRRLRAAPDYRRAQAPPPAGDVDAYPPMLDAQNGLLRRNRYRQE